jgi:hypothetical protein
VVVHQPHAIPLPADRGGHLAQTLLETDRGEDLPRRPLLALVHDVAEPELERIEAERVGDDVRLRLDGEVGLRSRGRPKGAEVRLVGIDGVALEQQVGDPVRPGQHQGGHRRDAGTRSGEGAGVEPQTALAGEDPPVARHPGLELDDRRLPRIGRRQLLLARRHHLHGPAGLARQQRSEVLDADPQLAAEAAADARNDHAHA